MTTAAKLVGLAVVIGLIIIGIQALPAWFWHPLGECQGTPAAVTRCKSYNFWSGVSGANITLPITALAFAAGWWAKHNCHIKGCWRLQWHPHPDHGHPVCKRHHPDSALHA